MDAYSNFVHHSYLTVDGYYDPKTVWTAATPAGDSVGGHAVVITGWGSYKGIDYWMVKNRYYCVRARVVLRSISL